MPTIPCQLFMSWRRRESKHICALWWRELTGLEDGGPWGLALTVANECGCLTRDILISLLQQRWMSLSDSASFMTETLASGRPTMAAWSIKVTFGRLDQNCSPSNFSSWRCPVALPSPDPALPTEFAQPPS